MKNYVFFRKRKRITLLNSVKSFSLYEQIGAISLWYQFMILWLFPLLLVPAGSPSRGASPDVILCGWLGLKHQLTNKIMLCYVMLFISQVITPQVKFFSLLIFRGHSTRNVHPAGRPILFCRPTQEPVLATANAGKNRERFWKNAVEWTGRVEISKDKIPGSRRSMYGYILTYSRL